MSTQLMWVIVIVAVAVAIAAVAFAVSRRQQSVRLRRRFGPEYDRAVQESGTVATAEARLRAREARVERLNIRPLSASDSARFSTAWREVQTHFVDDPSGAIVDADRLVGDVMRARGYPMSEFDQRVADISVDHPNVVTNYRAARDIARSHVEGRANTEDLRQAMVHYRALFTDLLETQPHAVTAPRAAVAGRGRS
jgi:hypothetical protein